LRLKYFFQGVAVDAAFAPILHQNETMRPRAEHIRMKQAPHSIPDHRLHGTPAGAYRKHVCGPAESIRNQSPPWLFPLLPAHIAEAHKLAARDSKLLDLNLTAEV